MEKDRSYQKVILFLKELGLNDSEINKVITFFKDHYNTEENVYPKMISTTKMLLDYGFSKEEIKIIAKEFHALYAYNTEFLKERLSKFERIGYSKDQIKKMMRRCPPVFRTSDEKMEERKQLLNKIGFSNKDFITMTYKNPYIFIRGEEQLTANLSYLSQIGFSLEEGKIIFRKFPRIIGMDSSYISDKLNFLIKTGFKKETILSMIKITPSILAYSESSIMERLNTVQSLGFTFEEAINIYSISKGLFTTRPEDIISKMNCIIAAGYNIDEARIIIKKYPAILSLNIDSIKDKLEYYNEIGLHDIIVRAPKNLIQSLTLSKARLGYFKRNGINIDESNHRKLFMGEKQFIKQFNKTKEELIEEDTGSSVIISHAKFDTKEYEKVFVRK